MPTKSLAGAVSRTDWLSLSSLQCRRSR